MAAPTLEIDVDPVWGEDTDWEALAARAAAAAAAVAPELASEALLVSLVMADDDEVHALNRQWRAKDAATNVLSFPMLSRAEVLRAAADPDHEGMLGDMILAHGVCGREAADKGIALEAHAAHLIVHGLLHLAGYDHETSSGETGSGETGSDGAAAMEALEINALARMGLPDPYAP